MSGLIIFLEVTPQLVLSGVFIALRIDYIMEPNLSVGIDEVFTSKTGDFSQCQAFASFLPLF